MFESTDARAMREYALQVAIPEMPQLPGEIPAEASAGDRFILERMPIAARLARRHARFGGEWEDLFQEACLALVETARSLAGQEAEARTEALAVLWMRRRIVLALARRATWLSAMPGYALRDWVRAQRARRELSAALGRQPEVREIAAAARMTEARAAEMTALPELGLSLEGIIAHAGESAIAAQEDAQAARRREAQDVRAAVERLPEPMRSVIACQFGIGRRRVPVRELARQMRLAPRTVIALRQAGLARLREEMGR